MYKSGIKFLVFLNIVVSVSAVATEPTNYLYISSGQLKESTKLLQRSDIAGVQIVYNWRTLEPIEGKYNVEPILKDLTYLNAYKKKLFIQIQDRFFEKEARYIPDYLLKNTRFKGGLAPQFDNPGEGKPVGSGWVTKQWEPEVRKRYQALLNELAHQFDGKIYGINLPETAIDLDEKNPPNGFTCDKYFNAEIENITYARRVFKKSHVIQYVNFWPCEWNNDHNYMGRLFKLASVEGIGLGGPDIIPANKNQMHNSYPFFNKYKGKLPLVAMAVQEPTLSYKDPKTGKPFRKEDFVRFSENYLGVDIIFWSPESSWLVNRQVTHPVH